MDRVKTYRLGKTMVHLFCLFLILMVSQTQMEGLTFIIAWQTRRWPLPVAGKIRSRIPVSINQPTFLPLGGSFHQILLFISFGSKKTASNLHNDYIHVVLSLCLLKIQSREPTNHDDSRPLHHKSRLNLLLF